MKTLAIGDIHGRAPALKDVLKKAQFDYNNDTLITLGDIVDGYPWTKECIDILLKINKRISIMGNHDCLPEETEILTQKGWLKYTELSYNDLCFSYDPETHLGKWMPITKIIIKNYSGPIITINTNRLKLKITPTHRILCKFRISSIKNKWSEYQYIKANQLKSRIRIPSCASDNCKEYDISDDKIQLTAWILTDGGIDKHGYIRIYQSKKENCKNIYDLLSNAGYTFSTISRNRDISSICGKPLKKHPLPSIEFIMTANSSSKIREFVPSKDEIPEWVHKLSNRQFDIFIETVIDGDGSRYPDSRNQSTYILYGTKKFLTSMQGLCVTKGYCSTFATSTRGDFRLNICKKQTVEFDKHVSVSKGWYDGIVWCIKTPLTNFMVRHNMTCCFTGNSWTLNWIKTGEEPPIWTTQGGIRTLESYAFDRKNVPCSHAQMIENSLLYHVDKNNNIFCHGGFDPDLRIESQDSETILWDRTLCRLAHDTYVKYPDLPFKIGSYNKIFLGHTSTGFYDPQFRPQIYGNVIMLDTGGGDRGKLTIMDIDTLEYWQSDKR